MSRNIIFIISLLAFLGFVMLVARTYASTLKVSHLAVKGTVLASLLIPFLFILSIVAGRGSRTMHPILYTLINSIAGIAYYLFLSGILLLIVVLVYKLSNRAMPYIVPILFLGIGLLAAVIGLVQAKFIKTTEYTVALDNLPESWNGKQAVLVTDTHFGLVNHRKFSDKVVSKIISLNPDLVLHAGDFYDGPKIETASITESWKKLTAVAPVFYAPGNHEEYGDYNTFLSSTKNAGITVLDDKSVEYEGMQIAGILYHSGKDPEESASAIKSLPLNGDMPTILINHPPTSLNAANEKGIDLMVSGHTHNGQFWPNNFLVRAIYGKYAKGLKNYKDMQVLTSTGVGTFGPPLRFLNTPEVVLITFKKR